ncbi:MAG: hypothetical protein WCF19_05120 [Chlamydiales bacterium]
MQKKLIVITCLSLLACSCAQHQMDTKKMDQNDQDQSKPMQPEKTTSESCCGAAKATAPQSQTAATPEVKVDKASQ